nr:uncharacterized protein LOC102555023 isoform X2 [Rattus norvegicus]
MPSWMNGKAGSGESGGAPRAQRRPTAAVPGQLGRTRRDPLARVPPARPPGPPPPPPGSEGPAGPAPSAAAHSALPGAASGSPASHSYQAGLLSTHFPILFQVDLTSLPQQQPPPPKLRLAGKHLSPHWKWPRSYLSLALPASLSSHPPHLFLVFPSCSPPPLLPPPICLCLAMGVLFFISVCHTAPP